MQMEVVAIDSQLWRWQRVRCNAFAQGVGEAAGGEARTQLQQRRLREQPRCRMRSWSQELGRMMDPSVSAVRLFCSSSLKLCGPDIFVLYGDRG
jgi:hypothetical protein